MNELAQDLLVARRAGAQIPFPSRLTPDDEAQAYVVQAEIAVALGARPAGWKVGHSPEGKPFAAPILDCDVVANHASISAPAGAPVKIEIELALRLGRDLPVRDAPYTREDVLDATESVLVGVELVRARYRVEPAAPFLALLADNFNNWGYVAGDSRLGFRSLPLDSLRVRIWIDGALAEDLIGSHPMGDPIAPALAWASGQCDRLGGLRAGQFITTGTLTTPIPVDRALRIEAKMDGLGAVAARFAQDGRNADPSAIRNLPNRPKSNKGAAPGRRSAQAGRS